MTKKILIDEAVVKQALESLERERVNYQLWDGEDGAPEYIYEAINALREALQVSTNGANDTQANNEVVNATEPVADIAALIVQSCCETDPADPVDPNTICIGVGDLDVIIKSTIENYRQAAEPVACKGIPRKGGEL